MKLFQVVSGLVNLDCLTLDTELSIALHDKFATCFSDKIVHIWHRFGTITFAPKSEFGVGKVPSCPICTGQFQLLSSTVAQEAIVINWAHAKLVEISMILVLMYLFYLHLEGKIRDNNGEILKYCYSK